MNLGSPTLAEIAENTKICPRYLRAIQDGRFEELPGGIYGRSYIRQYAAAVGRNPDPLLSVYIHSHTEEEVPVPEHPSLCERFRSVCEALMASWSS